MCQNVINHAGALLSSKQPSDHGNGKNRGMVIFLNHCEISKGCPETQLLSCGFFKTIYYIESLTGDRKLRFDRSINGDCIHVGIIRLCKSNEGLGGIGV